MRVGRGLFGWVLFISLAIMLIMLLKGTNPAYQEIPFTDFENMLAAHQVHSFTIDGDEVKGDVQPNVVLPGAQPSQNQKWFSTEYPQGTFSNTPALAELRRLSGGADPKSGDRPPSVIHARTRRGLRSRGLRSSRPR